MTGAVTLFRCCTWMMCFSSSHCVCVALCVLWRPPSFTEYTFLDFDAILHSRMCFLLESRLAIGPVIGHLIPRSPTYKSVVRTFRMDAIPSNPFDEEDVYLCIVRLAIGTARVHTYTQTSISMLPSPPTSPIPAPHALNALQ